MRIERLGMRLTQAGQRLDPAPLQSLKEADFDLGAT
ncbi:hypothetical protein YIM_28950 [Amycolatopsis sp. YIM 10]|nr:hypothetical protein YIM_28950 [Amycolatopsis sp. YIM 10]